MKIDDHSPLNRLSGGLGTGSPGQTQGSRTNAGGINGGQADRADLVRLSDLAALAKSTLGEEPSSRVEQLQKLYASGQYKVDAQALSQALVDAALQGD